MAHWYANKQAAEPFDEHLGEPFCILFRQGVEEISAKKVEPDAACKPLLSVLDGSKPAIDFQVWQNLPDTCCSQGQQNNTGKFPSSFSSVL